MRLLLIHTAGMEGSVALADTEAVPAVVSSEVLPGRSSSERLIPAVRRLMEVQGWRVRELATVAVVNGPGSFTGVRVGVSAAKGLSEASGVPVVAISRLALLAAAAGEGRVHAVLDAGRGEFYYGEYLNGRCLREALLSREGLKAAIDDGDTVRICEAKVAEASTGTPWTLVEEPPAANMLPLVLERMAAGLFGDVSLLDANYLRRTDAEIFAKPATRKDET